MIQPPIRRISSATLRLTTVLLLLLCALPAQRRASKAEAKDFPTLLQEAQQAFAEQDHARALSLLTEATRLAQREQRRRIRAAMPNLDGLTKSDTDDRDTSDAEASAAMFGALASAVPVEQEYTNEDGRRLVLRVTAASPAVAMFRAVMDNPALVEAQKQELIEYDGFKGLLDTQNGQLKLTVFVGEQGMIEAEAENLTVEQLLAAMSQANVAALAKPITPQKKRG